MKSSNKSTPIQTGSTSNTTSGKGTTNIVGGNKGNKATGQSPANMANKGNNTGCQSGTGGQTGRK